MSDKAKWMVKHVPRSPITGKRITPIQRNVLEQLADDHNEDRGLAQVSVGKLAPRIGIKPDNVRIHLNALESQFVIESRARLSDDGRTQLPNEYRFWFDPPFDEKVTRQVEKLLQLQAMSKAARPQQMELTPPPESGEGVPPKSREASPGIEGGVPPESGEGSLLNTTTFRERENARASVVSGENTAPDLKPLAMQIALAHPYAQQRRWEPQDVPVQHLVAILEAIRAEVKAQIAAYPSPEIGGGGTPENGAETDRGVLQVEQGLKLLAKVERIAREVPRSEWRFLKSLDKFMRLREYRMEPEDLYHAVPNRGGRDAGTENDRPSAQPGQAKQPSPAVQRGVTSRHHVDSAVERLRRRGAGRVDEADPS